MSTGVEVGLPWIWPIVREERDFLVCIGINIAKAIDFGENVGADRPHGAPACAPFVLRLACVSEIAYWNGTDGLTWIKCANLHYCICLSSFAQEGSTLTE